MTENIKATVEELKKLIKVDNVIGTPIETDEKILIPVTRVGFGFGVGENLINKESGSAIGAGAGVEPMSMVLIPKKGNNAEGIRVLDLTKRSETNKALSDLGLVITDLVKNYLESTENAPYDEGEYIEPEFTTADEDTE